VFSLFLVLDFHTPPVHCQHLQRIKKTHSTKQDLLLFITSLMFK
jgi:hypothetical protein